jgi:hypothetical protein
MELEQGTPNRRDRGRECTRDRQRRDPSHGSRGSKPRIRRGHIRLRRRRRHWRGPGWKRCAGRGGRRRGHPARLLHRELPQRNRLLGRSGRCGLGRLLSRLLLLTGLLTGLLARLLTWIGRGSRGRLSGGTPNRDGGRAPQETYKEKAEYESGAPAAAALASTDRALVRKVAVGQR